ncbi:LysM peptidoglycan-binding domain-containing protein [Thalassovita taeanensis]|uniref:Nucleoid-associated protein YgaU, contains BON and LysM domains n=1 Tax=Thalassovita taeanensis TaxID=657014 RepID=A0A1H9HV94_9RHOB|nr:LysM peptidoglycan-binding domain-containing protein [Thalassovita taeanensis]SEQ66197.1 Nucleoid-associated protein YgaU, contains BON and LysM domains [Thalassovita taeanensis]
MTKLNGLAGSQTMTIAAVAGGALVATAVGLYMTGVFDRAAPGNPSGDVVTAAQPILSQPATAVEPASDASNPAPEPAMTAPEPPRFDVVRVEADGTTLVAGVAASGATVDVLLDQLVLAAADPGSDGKFAAFLSIEPSEQPRVLSLVMHLGDQTIASLDQVIIAPAQQPQVVAAVQPAPQPPVQTAPAQTTPTQTATAGAPISDAGSAPPQPTAGTAGEATAAQPTQAPEQAPTTPSVAAVTPNTAGAAAPPPQTAQDQPAETTIATTQPTTATEAPTPAPAATPTTAAPAPKAPVVILSNADGVTVLQSPADDTAPPEVMASVSIDAVSYSDTGEVEVSGRGASIGMGTGSGFVRVYLDNTPITTSRIAADGRWHTELPGIDTGVYTLRVDQVSEDGKVTSRVETPFKREAAEKVAAVLPAASATGQPQVQVVTVQPGSTLWAIARDKYGEGRMFVRVFEANKDRIRDPDLIYPGQIFAVPD